MLRTLAVAGAGGSGGRGGSGGGDMTAAVAGALAAGAAAGRTGATGASAAGAVATGAAEGPVATVATAAPSEFCSGGRAGRWPTRRVQEGRALVAAVATAPPPSPRRNRRRKRGWSTSSSSGIVVRSVRGIAPASTTARRGHRSGRDCRSRDCSSDALRRSARSCTYVRMSVPTYVRTYSFRHQHQ